MLAAIDRQSGARHEMRFVGDQKQNTPRDIVAPAEPAHRDLLNDFFQNFRRHGTHHVGIDVARRDCIDGNP